MYKFSIFVLWVRMSLCRQFDYLQIQVNRGWEGLNKKMGTFKTKLHLKLHFKLFVLIDKKAKGDPSCTSLTHLLRRDKARLADHKRPALTFWMAWQYFIYLFLVYLKLLTSLFNSTVFTWTFSYFYNHTKLTIFDKLVHKKAVTCFYYYFEIW